MNTITMSGTTLHIRDEGPRDGRTLVFANSLGTDLRVWDRLLPLFDVTVMVDVPEHVLRARLRGRWERLGMDEAAIRSKLEENDLPNARLVRYGSVRADYQLQNH